MAMSCEETSQKCHTSPRYLIDVPRLPLHPHSQNHLIELFATVCDVAWKRWTSELDAPPANFRLDAVGRSRQGRLLRCGGPSQVEESHAEAAAIASEPSRRHSRTAKWTTLTELQTLAWRSPPMAIADVHPTCHIMSGQCTRKHNVQHLRVPSSPFRSEAENA